VYRSTRDGRLLVVNPAFVQMLGYSTAEELYKVSAGSLYWYPNDRDTFVRRMESEGEVRDVLSGNLCHCTGYEKPVQAVLHAAAVMRDEAKSPLEYSSGDTGKQPVARVRTERGSTAHIPTVSALASTLPVNGQLRVVGQSLPVIDAAKLVRGKAAFADDITLRGMLYGRVLTSPHAHAVIRDSDVAQAKALPGVHAIVTYKDVARVAYASSERPAEGPRDQYSLDYRVRYVGDRVAIVAA